MIAEKGSADWAGWSNQQYSMYQVAVKKLFICTGII